MVRSIILRIEIHGTRTGEGTRLIRQWQDRTHLVTVEQNGYEYLGSRYQSLSEIARLITGTRWSGPLFFGLKTNRAKSGSPRSK
jgi:hypothetical protein